MLLTTQDAFTEYEIIETLGVVRGNAVRARNIGASFVASFRTISGGEITEFTDLLSETREQAINRMIEHAKAKGADAIVGIRFTTSDIMQIAAELFAYGTAVKLKKKV
jgi:uncharacterized protein YbjQ (UPF0145 family)